MRNTKLSRDHRNHLKAIVDVFGPDEGVQFTQATWARIHQTLTMLLEDAQQPQAEAVPQAAEFCWLVEHFDIANKSTGLYYTGKVGIADRALTTMDPHQAQRYDTWRDANNASAKLGSTLAGTWRAMQHGFHRMEPQQAEAVPNIDHMATRLMGWRLPDDFRPDGGIAFDPYEYHREWPTGTNLLTHEQAKAMFEYVLKDQS